MGVARPTSVPIHRVLSHGLTVKRILSRRQGVRFLRRCGFNVIRILQVNGAGLINWRLFIQTEFVTALQAFDIVTVSRFFTRYKWIYC